MIYGFLNLPWWGDIIAMLILTQFTAAAITIYLHRHQAHKSLELHPIASHFFRLWLWISTGMETKKWVAIHRKHHVECDRENDPHSPQVYGIKKVLLEGSELYRMEAKNAYTLQRYGIGTPEDWLETNVYTKYSSKGIFILLAIYILLFGAPALLMWALQLLWTPFFGAGIINGIGHYFGYRNFDCNNASRNIIPFGIFIGGEELHNNHHQYPTSAKLSVKWWEIDMGWYYIKLLKLVGLAKIKRTIIMECTQ
jgi:stearoyl-CoA desaturase (delta-9 desaturase)